MPQANVSVGKMLLMELYLPEFETKYTEIFRYSDSFSFNNSEKVSGFRLNSVHTSCFI